MVFWQRSIILGRSYIRKIQTLRPLYIRIKTFECTSLLKAQAVKLYLLITSTTHYLLHSSRSMHGFGLLSDLTIASFMSACRSKFSTEKGRACL
jgi:hypothetical protein